MSKNDLQLSKPPLNLLLNPTVLKAKKPWEIDVVLLYLSRITVCKLF